MKNRTACPLDCFDACSIDYEDGKIRATKSGHTQGFLCQHLNHYDTFSRIESARYKGEVISIEEALNILKNILDENLKSETLYYRGSGNFALMQEVTECVFAKIGATLTDGSLCDGAGEAGIIEGRGSNKNMPLSEIAKSEVVILWGRNPHTTSSHLLPLLKGKKVIVIDPLRTQAAQNADLHIQIKPHTDSYLAMLLFRFLHINEACDDSFLERYASEYEEYYELTQSIRIKSMLENMGVTLGEIGKIIEMVRSKKVAIVCGVGVQKYRDGADVMRCIDAFAVALGLFSKEGSGVAYLGNSKEGVESPFKVKAKRVSKVDCAFEKYKTLFVQGANPLAQMPDSQRVKNAIAHTQNVVYFGLYENETSAVADLVIPAKTFLEKDDIRLSYSHNGMLPMPKLRESKIGVSEYALASYLANSYEVKLKDEAEYIAEFQSFAMQEDDGSLRVKDREVMPYKDGFDSSDGEFQFLEDIEIDRGVNKIVLRKNRDKERKKSSELFLLTPKSAKSLNSQFHREDSLYIHSDLGYVEGETVCITSSSGEVMLRVKHNNNLRLDCLLIYSGTPGVNNLTPSLHSYEGKSAVYQENRVTIKLLEER